MSTDKGVKLDSGKPRLGLVFKGFARALEEVGKVGTFGADKYTDDGWQYVENGIERYTDALYRHLLSYQSGEVRDKESNLLHLSHMAWNALAILSLSLETLSTCHYCNCTNNNYKPLGTYCNEDD